MGKEILVNVANRETRIAVLDDNQLVELRIEREEQVVGNIYKGRVENVLPGMDAAFVDIGLDRNAFLYVADILPEYVDSDDAEEEDEDTYEQEANVDSGAASPEAVREVIAAPRSGRRRRGSRDRQAVPAATEDTPLTPFDSASDSEMEIGSGTDEDEYLHFLSDPEREDSGADAPEGERASDLTAEHALDALHYDAEQSDESDEDMSEAVAREADALAEAHAIDEESDVDETDPVTVEATAFTSVRFEAQFPEEEEADVASLLDETSEDVVAEAAEASVNNIGLIEAGEAALVDATVDDVTSEFDTPEEREITAGVEAQEQSSEPEAKPTHASDSRPTKTGGIGQAKRPMHRGRPSRGPRRHVPIQELVQPRQELMLQVVKGPRGTKGSRVSTRMSLPGRYLVLMPDANNLGVSRKIEEARERDRLKTSVERFRQQGYGIIVRTEAEGRSMSELYQDYVMLTETWQSILAKSKTTPAPGLIHRDQSLIYTIMRDAFGSDIDRLIIDSQEDYARAYEIIDRISPDLSDRIHIYDGKKPLFEQFKVEEDIERLLRRKVWLKSGGYLVIDQTEALTSIDVNTGKFIGSTGLAETILQTNMEATSEIARQLRLRDIGGMIILDFIDMDNQRDKKSVQDALFRSLKNDRSRTKISSISPLGLIEMTRKRTKETVDVALTDTCPYCNGIGRISSAETVSMQVEREIGKMSDEVNSEAILVVAHPDVVANLIGEQGEDIDKLERQVRRSVYIRANQHFHVEKYEIEPGTSAKIEQSYPLPRRGQIVDGTMQKSLISALPWATAHIEGGYQIEISNGGKFLGQNIRVRLQNVARSYSVGEALNAGPAGIQKPNRPERSGNRPVGAGRP